MTIHETRCDRCRAVIGPQKKGLLTTREIRTQAFLLPPGELENINYDLCPRCHSDFIDFMAGVDVAKPPQYWDYQQDGR